MRADAFVLRAPRPGEQRAIADLARQTAWLGLPSLRGEIVDPTLYAALGTRYFLTEEPELATVVAAPAGDALKGFLLGTRDVRAYERALLASAPRALLGLALGGSWLGGQARRGLRALARSLLGGELVLPERVRAAFPATFRLALVEEARDHGLGALLLEGFFTRARERGVSGVHVQALSLDQARTTLYRRAGFQLVARWPLRAFSHAVEEPLELYTFTRAL